MKQFIFRDLRDPDPSLELSATSDINSTPKSLLRKRLIQAEKQLSELEEFTKIEKNIETCDSVSCFVLMFVIVFFLDL